MSGSLGHYQYVSDDGDTYRARMDDSNAAAVGAVTDETGTGTPHPELRKGYDMRHLYVEHPTTHARRRLYVTNPANTAWTGAAATVTMDWTDADTGVVAVVRGRVGERRRSI